jgi:hypothetical protein
MCSCRHVKLTCRCRCVMRNFITLKQTSSRTKHLPVWPLDASADAGFPASAEAIKGILFLGWESKVSYREG